MILNSIPTSTEAEQLDVEHEVRVGRNEARKALVAPRQVGRDGQVGSLAHGELDHAHIESRHHLCSPEFEPKWLPAITRGIKPCTVGQKARIMYHHGTTLLWIIHPVACFLYFDLHIRT